MISRGSICLRFYKETPVLGRLVDSSSPSKSVSSQNLGFCEIPNFSLRPSNLVASFLQILPQLRTEVTIEGLSIQGNYLFCFQVCI